jgi:hypothetical protein
MTTNKRRWIEAELRSSRAKRAIRAYVQMCIDGKIDWDVLGKLYRPNQKIPVATFKRLLKLKETKAMINEEFDRQLKLNGINIEKVLKEEKEILERTKEKGDYTNSIRILAAWRKSLGMDDTQTKQVEVGETNWIELLHKHDKDKALKE